MADSLDAPTVYRTGTPTLGVPVMAVTYAQSFGVVKPPWHQRGRSAFLRWYWRQWLRWGPSLRWWLLGQES